MSIKQKERGLGGHTSKQRLYYKHKGNVVYLQSSYEIKLAQILDDYDIEWIRPTPLIWSNESGEHRYYPDFYLPEHHIYIDTKNNYLMQKDKEKIENVSFQNNVKILMIGQNQINIDYIKRIIV